MSKRREEISRTLEAAGAELGAALLKISNTAKKGVGEASKKSSTHFRVLR